MPWQHVNDNYHNIDYAKQKYSMNKKKDNLLYVTIRFLYSSDASSTALSQIDRTLFELVVDETRFKSS
jgi:hypothetical protein